MSQETSDFIFGAFVLAIFLVFVFALGFLINKFKNARFTKAWSPLINIINGKVIEDGGGGATSYLLGTYRGRRMQASMSPDINRYSDGGDKINYFEVAAMDVPGKEDWTLSYETAVLGFGQTGLQIKSKDKALEAALNQAGVISMIAGFGNPTIKYSRSSQKLTFSEDVTPQWIPTPDRFRAELELLLRLVEVNQTVNT
ncbi:MAG TPA: hypothetical protein VEF04_01330 [Blastocatellia bacterium]|nr:hypothetical protein [Blastocatellia bacterium]